MNASISYIFKTLCIDLRVSQGITILLESIKALVYEVYISVVKSQDEGKNLLVFIMSVLCIKNWLHAPLHGFVEQFERS